MTKYKKIVEEALERPILSSTYLYKKGIPRGYAKLLLHNLFKRGVIHRVERGLYATVNDPIIVAGNIVFPSYISMYVALYLRGAFYQVPSVIQVVTTRRKKNKKIRFLDNLIEFYRIKKTYFFGFDYIMVQKFQVPVAKVEKAIIDIFYFLGDIVGTMDFSSINEERLKYYLKVINIKALERRVLRWYKNGIALK